MESRVCCSAAAAGWEGQGQWLLCCQPGLGPCHSMYQTLDFSAKGLGFQGSHLDKISKLSCFATLFCCPPQLPALPTACTDCQLEDSEVRSPREGLASSVPVLGAGWVEEKQYFCGLPFWVGKNLQSLAATACYSGSGMHIWDWGRGLFLSWSVSFGSRKDNFRFLGSQSQTNNSLKKPPKIS